VRYVVVAVSLALGLMAKPMLVTLPAVLLLMDVWPLRRLSIAPVDLPTLKTLVVEKLPLVGIVAASAIVTFAVQRQGGAVSGLELLPLSLRLANAAAAYARYLWLTIWPANLTLFYPFPVHPPIGPSIIGAIGLAVGTLAAVRLARRAPWVTVGWFWYVVMLLPVIGLVQIGSQSMADRYTYTPLVGIFIVVAWGVPALLERWPMRRVVLPAAAAAIVVACTVTARTQVSYWRDTVTAWQHAIDAVPDNFVAHDALGSLLIREGRIDEGIAQLRIALAVGPVFADTNYNLGVGLMKQGRNDEAEALFRAAIAKRPDYAEAHTNLGLVLAGKHQIDAAAAEYRAAIAADPELAEPHNNLGAVLASRGDNAGAIAEYRAALQLKPDLVQAHYRLGLALASTGPVDEAIVEYSTAIRLDPAFAPAYNDRCFALFAKGKFTEALADCDAAIRLEPTLAAAWNNRGFVRATQGAIPAAITDFTEAVRLDPSSASAHMNLGLALAGTGHIQEAVKQFEEVLRLDPQNAGAKRALASIGRVP
jgi:tetratricopeptide (TPR) repeat protein